MRLVARVASGVMALDQVSKYVVVRLMGLDHLGAIDVLPPWINFRMAWNRGVNFGLFAGEDQITRWVLVALAAVITAWVWRWVGRGEHSLRIRLCAGLLIGGALGNVIDRLAYGAVQDFLNMSTPFWNNPYSFNVADMAIFLGAGGLVLFSPDQGGKRRANPRR